MILVIAKCVNLPGEVFASLEMAGGMRISLAPDLIERLSHDVANCAVAIVASLIDRWRHIQHPS